MESQNKGLMKGLAEKPLIILVIGILLGNTDKIIQFVLPDLEKFFVTIEKFEDLSNKVDLLKEDQSKTLDKLTELSKQIKQQDFKLKPDN